MENYRISKSYRVYDIVLFGNGFTRYYRMGFNTFADALAFVSQVSDSHIEGVSITPV